MATVSNRFNVSVPVSVSVNASLMHHRFKMYEYRVSTFKQLASNAVNHQHCVYFCTSDIIKCTRKVSNRLGTVHPVSVPAQILTFQTSVKFHLTRAVFSACLAMLLFSLLNRNLTGDLQQAVDTTYQPLHLDRLQLLEKIILLCKMLPPKS